MNFHSCSSYKLYSWFFYIYKQHDTHNYYSKSRVRSLVSRLIQIMRYKPMCRTTLCLCIAAAIKGLIKRGDREIAHDRMRIAELIHPRRLIRLSSMDQQRKKCVVIMQIVWRSGSGTLKLNRVLEECWHDSAAVGLSVEKSLFCLRTQANRFDRWQARCAGHFGLCKQKLKLKQHRIDTAKSIHSALSTQHFFFFEYKKCSWKIAVCLWC